ncbi:MAG: hypothetical protein RLP09_02660 [Sandaracinaceae bacterium]
MSEYDRKRCALFASASTESNGEYERRGAPNTDKARRDQYIGKAGEIAARAILSGALLVSLVDMEIYSKDNKSWEPDLLIDNRVRVHVKTCDQWESTLPESWIFQAWDREVFQDFTDEDLVMFVTRTDEAEWTVRFVIRVSELHRHKLFDAPLARRHREHKRAVYASRLEAFREDAS